jgi:hypothetical protein
MIYNTEGQKTTKLKLEYQNMKELIILVDSINWDLIGKGRVGKEGRVEKATVGRVG